MRSRLATLATASLLLGTYSTGLAAEDKMTPLQEKMKTCNG